MVAMYELLCVYVCACQLRRKCDFQMMLSEFFLSSLNLWSFFVKPLLYLMFFVVVAIVVVIAVIVVVVDGIGG